MYAKWSANTYAIEYYTYDGASKLGTSNHTYAAAKALTTMSSLGGSAPSSKVSFYGWATSANSTTRAYSDGESVTSLTSTSGGTVKLYAIWRSSGVTLTYKSGVNNEEISTSDTYYYYNAATSVSIKTAYTSDILYWNNLGWRDDTIAGDKEYSMNTSYSFSSSTILYGAYSRIITVYYSGNNNTGGSTSNTIKTIYLNSNSTTTSDQTITLASNGFTKTGYIFSKWEERYTYEQYGAGTSYNPNFSYNDQEDGDLKVYMSAVWTAKTKSISFQITYDTSTFSGPSSAYSTSTYQTLSKSSTTLRYGTSESITASPAYPDDRYTGSVSCTNGITATLTAGSGTTDRTDTIKVTNNSDSTTSSACTIKYTPKWEGIAYGSYTTDDTTISYSGTTWTVKKDNGNDVGLVLNTNAGSGSYKSDIQSELSTKLSSLSGATTTAIDDANNGGIVAQSSGAYVSSDGGIYTGYEDVNYWTSSGYFFNSLDRTFYTLNSKTYLYDDSQARGDGAVKSTSVNSSYSTSATLSKGIKKTTGSSYYSVSGSTLTLKKASKTCTAEATSSKLALTMTRLTPGLGGGINSETCTKSSTALCFRYRTYTYDDGTYTIKSGSDSYDSVTNYVATAYNYICGGDDAGTRVVYSYNSSKSFKYGNQATGTGWSGDSWSRDNAVNYVYLNDNSEYWNGRFAGYAITSVENGYEKETTISGYSRTIRYYHYNTFEDSTFCKKRTVCTTSDVTRNLYYRPYIIVRER